MRDLFRTNLGEDFMAVPGRADRAGDVVGNEEYDDHGVVKKINDAIKNGNKRGLSSGDLRAIQSYFQRMIALAEHNAQTIQLQNLRNQQESFGKLPK